MTDSSALSTSRLKKRERDRRAQQNYRDKRVAYSKTLEQRVKELEAELESLRASHEDVCRENEVLRGRQGQVEEMVARWKTKDASGTPESSRTPCQIPSQTPSQTPTEIPTQTQSPSSEGGGSSSGSSSSSIDASAATSHPEDDGTGLEMISYPSYPSSRRALAPRQPWEMTPAHMEGEAILSEAFAQCLASIDLIHASPVDPKAADFLYGSKTNFLADCIHRATRIWAVGDPERLAFGWLMYRLVKWMAQPNEVHYSRLCDFQAPTAEQLCHPHPRFIDFLPWPVLRSNLIRGQHAFDLWECRGLMAYCVKLKWPWHEPTVEQDAQGELVVRADFYSTFTSLDGWAIAGDLFDRCPGFFVGLDRSSMDY